MYILCTGSQIVSVIDVKTDKVIENILVGSSPTDILYDSVNDTMYVSHRVSFNQDSNAIEIIGETNQNATSNTISG